MARACLSLVRANDTVAQAEPICREVSTSPRHAADLVGLLGAAIRGEFTLPDFPPRETGPVGRLRASLDGAGNETTAADPTPAASPRDGTIASTRWDNTVVLSW